jgi:hypothetical protein
LLKAPNKSIWVRQRRESGTRLASLDGSSCGIDLRASRAARPGIDPCDFNDRRTNATVLKGTVAFALFDARGNQSWVLAAAAGAVGVAADAAVAAGAATLPAVAGCALPCT